MSARFAELMALSQSQTQQHNAATQQLLADKKRKDEQRKREQEAREAREREMQAIIVRRRLEEARRAEERQRQAEEDRARKEAALARKEEQHRLDLLYGKDKRSAASSSTHGRSRKGKGGEQDDDEEMGSSMLTREEKRMRRLNNDLNRSFVSKRKDTFYSSVNAMRRPGRSAAHEIIDSQKGNHTPGSAGSSADDGSSRQSLRKRLASMPQQLIKLNTVKRDTRTIDEILTDMQRAKEARVIAGEDARGFKDWFASKEKEKEKEREKEKAEAALLTPTSIPGLRNARSLSRSSSEGPLSADPGRRAKSAVRSMDGSGRSTPNAPKPPEKKEPRTKVTIVKPERRGSIYFDKVDTKTKPAASIPPKTNAMSSAKHSNGTPARASVPHMDRGAVLPSKRKRSYSPESLYDSDDLDDDVDMNDDYGPRGRSAKAARPRNDISSEIWRLFGKDRDRYMRNDVYSDDEDDMEVDADALRREELRSERLAKREDLAALEEERRHEEAKRRKKLQKDRDRKIEGAGEGS